MTNLDMALKYMALYNEHKIVYGQGGWLQPATNENKNYFLNAYAKNRENLTIRNGIITAPATHFIGDCVCTVKSFVDNLVGVDHQTNDMRKPCKDISVEDLLKTECVDVSTDMSSILIFEFMAYADYSHCGVYMGEIDGKRMVAEVTYRFNNGLQLIDMDCPERRGMWKYHGKMWNWMDYKYKEKSLPNVNPSPAPAPVVDTNKLKAMVDTKVKAKKGDKGSYVKEIQKVLIARGYSCGKSGADGDFGTNTEKAVIAFQAANHLTTDGVVGYNTITRLIG